MTSSRLAGTAALCRQSLHLGSATAGYHDGQERNEPASGAGGLSIAGQKSIGFLTRTLTDSTTGEPLAAVLLPNAINPTSAFLQILPLERVTETDLTMEQAMSMLMTGGAVGPETIQYSQAGSGEPAALSRLGTGSSGQTIMPRFRVSWLGSPPIFFGVLAFERDLAQADVLKPGPDQSHWNDAEKRGQQNGRRTGSGGLGSNAEKAGQRRGHKGDLGKPAQNREAGRR